MRVLTLFLLVALGCGCQHLEPVEVSPYFDMDSLVDAQLSRIVRAQASLAKKTTLNGSTDEHTITPDSAQWANELQIFHRANINKPVLRGVYREKRSDQGDLSVLTYIPDSSKERTVRDLTIIRDKAKGTLHRIEATIVENNPLYATRRELQMVFGPDNILSSYEVTGHQKMTMTDSVNFMIQATIVRQP